MIHQEHFQGSSIVIKLRNLYENPKQSFCSFRAFLQNFSMQSMPNSYLVVGLVHINNIKSRERPKSAPYLRLKNSKRTSKYSLLRYRKNPKVEPNWHTRGDTLKFFIHSVANQKKLKEGHFW